jgi:hypothetical protein
MGRKFQDLYAAVKKFFDESMESPPGTEGVLALPHHAVPLPRTCQPGKGEDR